MVEIRVERLAGDAFRVALRDARGESVHTVTATPEQLRRYGGEQQPERLLERSFEFLLEREPREAILRSFELPVIERYFPEYAELIARRL
jgi:hypothetical protein